MNAMIRSTLLLGSALLLSLAGCGGPTFHPADRVDGDGDGFFRVSDPSLIADLSVTELTSLQLDCDDDNDDIFPGAAELCDGLDNDCDFQLSPLELDDDGDGYTECGWDPAARLSTTDRDCNDDPDGFGSLQAPNLPEICGAPPLDGVPRFGFDSRRWQLGLDDNCDGVVLEGETDADRDGHFAGCDGQDLSEGEGADLGSDCDDTDPDIRPTISPAECITGASYDSDCGPPNLANQIAFFRDRDQDGDGDSNASIVFICQNEEPPPLTIQGEGNQATDCDDNNAQVHGLDLDGDGFVSCGSASDFPPGGDIYPSGVGADNEPAAFPGAAEACDGIDNDLNGAVDGVFDADADGSFTDPAIAGVFEPATDGCVSIYGEGDIDCDDTDASLNQRDLDGDNDSTCDGDCNDGNANVQGRDQDGDGVTTCQVPPDCDDFDPAANYDDVDGDGFPSCGIGTTPPDCDDLEALVFPGHAQQCDGIDDTDCDGVLDPLEADNDGDGSSECGGDCDDQNPALNIDDLDGDGFDSCSGECDDSDPSVYPGAPVLCDGVSDNDCNGVVDANERDADNDGSSLCDGDCNDFDASVEVLDSDGDGVTTCAGDCDDSDTGFPADSDGDGWSNCPALNTLPDCDDSDASLNWNDSDGDGAATCATVADCDDFDGSLNQLDVDGDGETSCDGDCFDEEAAASSSTVEVADGIDNDCDGVADEGLLSPGALQILEIMISADPSTGDAAGEYLELRTFTSHVVDLRGWTVEISDGSSAYPWTFPVDADPNMAFPVASAGRTVLSRSGTDAVFGFSVTDLLWGATVFPDLGGSVTLIEPGGAIIDTVNWTASGCTANCASGTSNPVYAPGMAPFRRGYAMSVAQSSVGSNTQVANDDLSNWCEVQDPLGSVDHGSPGVVTVDEGPCGN